MLCNWNVWGGKTALINKVLGEDRFITMPVRASDAKGIQPLGVNLRQKWWALIDTPV